MNVCRVCSERKSAEDFYGSDRRCKACESLRNKEWYKKNQEEVRRKSLARYHLSSKDPKSTKSKNLKIKYGITLEDFERISELQEDKCKICKEEKVLVVDHDHATGEIRGLLCSKCNLGLGHFQDDRKRLGEAIIYLSEALGTEKEV